MIDGYAPRRRSAPLAFAVFLTAMTAGRWFGPACSTATAGCVVLRVSPLVALVGLLLFVFGPLLPLGFRRCVLLGPGAALGFPVGMSAAADDPAWPPARVSVVASIGYIAFLAGPPLIGFLGDRSACCGPSP